MNEPGEIGRASRLFIIDPRGKLLLFRYAPAYRAPFWSTVGGRVDEGEDHRSAARRELREETGFRAPVGRLLRTREDTYAIDEGPPKMWIEHYYLVETEEPVDRAGWTPAERAVIRDSRWWTLDELRASSERFLPEWLPDLLEATLNEMAEQES